MPKRARTKFTLTEAAGVRTVWEANPDFTMGKIGLNDFITVYVATEELEKQYAKEEVELSGTRRKRDEKARELQGLVTRFRSGMRSHFGPDSPEYGQAGGTTDSARRSPARKPKPVSDTNSAATASA